MQIFVMYTRQNTESPQNACQSPSTRADGVKEKGAAGEGKNNSIQNNFLSSLSSSVESILFLNRSARSIIKSLKISAGILDLT